MLIFMIYITILRLIFPVFEIKLYVKVRGITVGSLSIEYLTAGDPSSSFVIMASKERGIL